MKKDVGETSSPPFRPQGKKKEFWLDSFWFPLRTFLELSEELNIHLCGAMLNCRIYLLCQTKGVPHF